MADKRLTELELLADPEGTDIMHVVDISDFTGSANGTSKKATVKDLVVAGGGAAENQIIINSVSDFAVQDASTITLEEGKTYIRGAGISTSKRFIVSKRVTVSSPSAVIDDLWEYTGTDSMFTGLDVGFFSAYNLAVRCPDAFQIFSFQDTALLNVSGIQLRFCFAFSSGPTSIAAKKWGTFRDLESLGMDTCAVAGAQAGFGLQDGISLSGISIIGLSIKTVAFFSVESTFISLDLGTVVITQFFNIDSLVSIGGVPGGVGISGLSNSANIGSGIVANISNSEFLGAITPLSGITTSDVRYDFVSSPPLENSSKAADMFLSIPQTVIIATQSVFVPIAGIEWDSDVEERFSVSADGIMTYTSPISSKGLVIISATVAKIGGGSDQIQMAIAINGTVSVKTIVGTQNATATTLMCTGIYNLVENDTIQAFISNDGSTSNINVSACSLIAINGF